MKQGKISIAVLVSGGGTNLQALIDAEQEGRLPSGQITLVISNKKDAYALTRAEQAGIQTLWLSRKELGQERFEEELAAVLEENQIDVIILAGFLCILSENFTSKYPVERCTISALSFNRTGTEIQPHDLTLIYHEATEANLMNSGFSYDEAHEMANQKYNYKKELDEFNNK